jgi:hypothetical protein
MSDPPLVVLISLLYQKTAKIQGNLQKSVLLARFSHAVHIRVGDLRANSMLFSSNIKKLSQTDFIIKP